MGTLNMGTPAHYDLLVTRGDDGALLVEITDSEGALIDVSSAAWLCQIRNLNGMLEAQMTVTVQGLGTVRLDLDSAASSQVTHRSYWDLQMTLNDWVTTLIGGSVLVTKDASYVDT